MQQTWTGMVHFVDETVANLTAAIRRNGRWERSVLVWVSERMCMQPDSCKSSLCMIICALDPTIAQTTDNGSPVECGGSNALLRGGKETNFEGGVRTPGT